MEQRIFVILIEVGNVICVVEGDRNVNRHFRVYGRRKKNRGGDEGFSNETGLVVSWLFKFKSLHRPPKDVVKNVPHVLF